MLVKFKFKIIDFLIICIEKLISNEMDGKVHVVILDDEMYREYSEFKDNTFLIYENEHELKEDFPNASLTNRKDTIQ